MVALGGGVIWPPFVKGYNEKIFESEKFPLRVAGNAVRGAQINVLELKFSLFAQRTTFFAAKKNLRGVKLFNDHLRQHRIRQKTFRIDGLRGAVCENRDFIWSPKQKQFCLGSQTKAILFGIPNKSNFIWDPK